jgi:hypothetical protein
MKNLGCKIAVTAAFALATAFVAGVNVRAQDDDDKPVRLSANLSTFNEVMPKGTGAAALSAPSSAKMARC